MAISAEEDDAEEDVWQRAWHVVLRRPRLRRPHVHLLCRRSVREHDRVVLAYPSGGNAWIAAVQAHEHGCLVLAGDQPEQASCPVEDRIGHRHPAPSLVQPGYRDVGVRDVEHRIPDQRQRCVSSDPIEITRSRPGGDPTICEDVFPRIGRPPRRGRPIPRASHGSAQDRLSHYQRLARSCSGSGPHDPRGYAFVRLHT